MGSKLINRKIEKLGKKLRKVNHIITMLHFPCKKQQNWLKWGKNGDFCEQVFKIKKLESHFGVFESGIPVYGQG